jgi:hypothetical protein
VIGEPEEMDAKLAALRGGRSCEKEEPQEGGA